VPRLPSDAYPGQVLFPQAQVTSTTIARATQLVAETLTHPTTSLTKPRVSQLVVESLASGTHLALIATAGLRLASTATLTRATQPIAATAALQIASTATLTRATQPIAATAALRIATTATLTRVALNQGHVTQLTVDTIVHPSVRAQVSQVVVDVVATRDVLAQMTQLVVETLVSTETLFTRDPEIGLTWVEFTDRTGAVHVWSDVALPDPQSYFYGYKDNRVTKWGTIRRSLSDDQGQYVGSEFRWTVSDADRAIRALLADPATKYVANRPITVRSVPDAVRRRLERPRDVYVGTVREYQPSSPLTFDFIARDPFDALFSVTGDQRFPRRTITTDDFPGCDGSFTVGGDPSTVPATPGTEIPIGALGLPVPIIYGMIQDAAGELGDGQCPAVLVGVKTLSDGHDYYQWVVAGHACLAIEAVYVQNNIEPDTALDVGGVWKVPGYPGWAAEFGSTQYEDINGRRYTTLYGRRGPQAFITSSTTGVPTGSPGVVYAPAHGLTNGLTRIEGHRGSTPDLNGTWTITVVDADHFTVPVEITQDGAGGYALQAAGPDIAAGAVAAIGLSVPFSLTVSGIESVGDGTGTLLTDAFAQYRHCLQNWIVGDYQSGAWLPTPTFPGPDALPIIDDGSFDQASAIAHRRISGGYRGDWVLGWTAVGPSRARIGGDRLPARDLLQRFGMSFDCQVGFNRRSQFFVSLADDMATGVIHLTDMVDVVQNSLAITDNVQRLWNRVPFRHTQDYFNRMSGPDAKPLVANQDDVNWRSLNSGITMVEDSASITNYSLDPAHPTPLIAPTQYLYLVRGKNRDIDDDAMLQGTATANDVVGRFLNRHKDPPRTVDCQIGVVGLNVELGDVVLLTHFAGVGATGWTDVRLRVIAHEADPASHLVRLTAEEVRDLAPEGGA
jgi:hypothetical protein